MWTAPYLSSDAVALVSLHTGPFTITGWFQPTVSGSAYAPTPFITGPAWNVSLNADGTLSFRVNNSVSSTSTVVATPAPISLGWNFWAITYDPNTLSIAIWLNGVSTSTPLLALADSTLSSVSSNGDFELGNPGLVQSAAPNGFSLDAVGVWARVLAGADILAIYNSGQGEDYPFLGGPFSLVFQANLVNSTSTPLVICSQDSVYAVSESIQGTGYAAFFNLLYEGTAATPGYLWTADNFSDKVILAQHDNPPLYWTPPSASAFLLPGLPVGSMFDGVAMFANHVVLWQGDTLTWSDVDNFTCYIPVAETAVSSVLTLTAPFVQPPPGGSVTVQVTAPTSVVLSLSMSGDMTFPSTEVGSTAQALLSLINTGNGPISISGIALPAGFSGNFTGVLPVGGSQSVIITFTPTAGITYSGSIVVGAVGTGTSSSTTVLGTTVYPISGTGTAVTMVVNLSGVLDFGNVVETRTLTSALVVSNTGNAALSITGITLPNGFTTTFTTGTVAAGDNLNIPIVFAPTAALLYSGDITVVSNATSGTNFINVSGTGVRSLTYGTVFVTDNGTCQFGNVVAGTTATGTITITNTSSVDVRVYAPTAPSGFAAGPPGVEAPTDLLGFASTTLTVTFEPTMAQGYAGALVVPCYIPASGAAALGTNTVEIVGTGTSAGPVISLSGSINYGDVPFGSILQAILSIYNPGLSNLVISSITYPSSFSGPTSVTVAAGQTSNLLVTFTPAATGSVAIAYSGDISITSNASNLPTASYGVSGEGIPIPGPVPLVADQVVTLTDTSNSAQTYYDYYTVTGMSGNSLYLTLMDLTGATPAGNTIAANGVQFFTVDANEAGTTIVSGSRMNGPILDIIPQGDYAYIFKSRSIQSIQYTGLGNGTFYIHNEISGEGPIGRNAVTDSGDGRMFFLGHKELYLYEGGPKPQPICQQYTRQLYAEIDRTRLDQILLFHNENRKEIWTIYPVTGGTFKVLVWNYVEDSASIDIYAVPGLNLQPSAIGYVDWSADTTWSQFGDTTWAQVSTALDWDSLVSASINHAPVFGSFDGGLRLHGQVYDREGYGYTAISETMDYDLGQPDIFKYVDVIVLSLQLASTVIGAPAVPAGSVFYVQVGTQASLGDNEGITWSAPYPVLVDGTQPTPVKVNPGGSGRYLRLRFTSSDPDVQWRVSQFEVHCRPGSFY